MSGHPQPDLLVSVKEPAFFVGVARTADFCRRWRRCGLSHLLAKPFKLRELVSKSANDLIEIPALELKPPRVSFRLPRTNRLLNVSLVDLVGKTPSGARLGPLYQS